MTKTQAKPILFSTKAAPADLKWLKKDAAAHGRSLLSHTAKILADHCASFRKA